MKYPHGSNLTMIPSFADEYVGKVEPKVENKKSMKFVKAVDNKSNVITESLTSVDIKLPKSSQSKSKEEEEEKKKKKEEKKYKILKQTFKVMTLETIDSYPNIKPEDIKVENYDNTNISVEMNKNIIIQGVLYDKLSNISTEIENDKVKIIISKEKHGMWPCVLKTDPENQVQQKTFDELTKYRYIYFKIVLQPLMD